MTTPFEVIHVSTYMARVLRVRAGSITWRTTGRLPVLVHSQVTSSREIWRRYELA